MSITIVNADSKKNQPSGAGLEIMGQLIEYLLATTLVVLCIAVSLYAEDGYHKIGNVKFAVYRHIMVVGCAIIFIVMVPYVVFWMREHKKLRLSVTDGCVLAYLLLSGVSVVSGGFYGDALWGYDGWNMGIMSQISFVLLYLLLSRFGRYYRLILSVLCAAACVVYVIGILHRLQIDPIGFYVGLTDYQKTQFLSTLGQATWYGSFLSVTLPIGIGVFLYADKKMWRILGGIMMALGFCTLVTQNSDSAYFALAGAFLIFFMISAMNWKAMCRFAGVLTLFYAAGKIMYFLMQIRPNPEFEADFMTRIMWTSGATWVMLFACLSVTIILYVSGTRADSRKYPTALMHRMRQIVPAAVIAAVVGVITVIILQTEGVLPKVISDRLEEVSYFNWHNEWGNGRGRIWTFSIKMFMEADVELKLFGVGPDCFHSYVVNHYSDEQILYWGKKQLTNAHNEWLSSLINVGILGTVSYIGIYVTAVRRFFREHQRNILLAGIAASSMSYMCYNFFCYQQVLCTPFIFMLMGIGEYILRDSVDKT